MTRTTMRSHRYVLTALMWASVVSASFAQTQITPDKNKYTPAQDVQIGREATTEVRRELPMLNDARVDAYVERVGRDLVRGIPQQFQHDEFRYTFDVVNQKEINAFALPGGPMFLNRGMIEAAKSEGEMAGVMAHEIAHVALRHGTAQATKGQKFQIGAIAGQILGAIVGGAAGSVIAQGSQFGLGAYFLKYGREYERQADLLGAQILARAGYDPRRMADMFQTIEKQGGGQGGPEWLSSHPNPGNRYEAIVKEAESLRVQGSAPSEAEFQSAQSRLRSMKPAYTAEQIARAKQNGGRLPSAGGGNPNDRPVRGRNVQVEPPSGQFQPVTLGNFLRASVPSNWRQNSSNEDSVTFAPEAAYYQGQDGATGFTHGLQLGVIESRSSDLQDTTEELIQSLQRGNPQIQRQNNGYIRENIGGRNGLTTTLRNVSEVTGGAESITVSTVPLRDGNALYVITVAPLEEMNRYQQTFRRMKQSLQINDRQLAQR
jgi:Zn-dependent protease with chaperone function